MKLFLASGLLRSFAVPPIPLALARKARARRTRVAVIAIRRLEARGITRLPGCACWQCKALGSCGCGKQLLMSASIRKTDRDLGCSTPLEDFFF